MRGAIRSAAACPISASISRAARTFTYDLADMGRYYADYVRLMAHVDAVLPGRVHRVIYERMVDDTEAEVRALLAYCGLEFEPACLEFHKTERAVRTAAPSRCASRSIATRPRNGAPTKRILGPLSDALGPVLEAYPDVTARLYRNASRNNCRRESVGCIDKRRRRVTLCATCIRNGGIR